MSPTVFDCVRADTAAMYTEASGGKKRLELLWGDRVTVLERQAGRAKVRARGHEGWVPEEALGGTPLLELYFIDVGQGDGVLIVTPETEPRHILIDGGYNRAKLPTHHNAADFVDWKFFKDYGRAQIVIDAMIASHCDADHYGGLWDLINPDECEDLDIDDVRVEAFYHAGVSRWRKPGGGSWLGDVVESDGKKYLGQLLEGRTAALDALGANAQPALHGEWADFIRRATAAKRTDGKPCTIKRLSHRHGHVPGFEPGQGEVHLKVLAPVETKVGQQEALPRFGAQDSWNTNGNSLCLRLDYKHARVLLTGDLNDKSHKLLLEHYGGDPSVFECDVSKACHHGSDNVSLAFLKATKPAVTVISSGDTEQHDHPRPSITAASAITGLVTVKGDRLKTPLVYSTEIGRSASYGEPIRLEIKNNAGEVTTISKAQLKNTKVFYEETKAGDLNPRTRSRTLGSTLVVASLVYGLVNVRTDGQKILCATLNEKDYTWNTEEVQARF